MTRTKNFLRQNFFKVFPKTPFFHDLCHPDHYEPKIFFRFLKSGPEGFPIMSVNVECPLLAQKTRLLSHKILKRAGHKRTWADKHDETFLRMIKDSSRNRPEIRLNPVPASKSGSGSSWKKFAGFLPDSSFFTEKIKKIFSAFNELSSINC